MARHLVARPDDIAGESCLDDGAVGIVGVSLEGGRSHREAVSLDVSYRDDRTATASGLIFSPGAISHRMIRRLGLA